MIHGMYKGKTQGLQKRAGYSLFVYFAVNFLLRSSKQAPYLAPSITMGSFHGIIQPNGVVLKIAIAQAMTRLGGSLIAVQGVGTKGGYGQFRAKLGYEQKSNLHVYDISSHLLHISCRYRVQW